MAKITKKNQIIVKKYGRIPDIVVEYKKQMNNEKRGGFMIELTRFNETKFTLNAEIIEMIEETPDTVITLTTGKKIIVKESRQEVSNLVKLYRYEVNSGINLQ